MDDLSEIRELAARRSYIDALTASEKVMRK